MGSQAMLRIKQTWITLRYKAEIYKAQRTGTMRIYCAKRHGWTDAVFDMVSWDMVGRVQWKLTHTKRMQTCKIMHGWLPTGHMQQYITGINQCPGCECKDETIMHLFRCTNPQMQKKREEIITQFHKKGLKKKVPCHVLEAFCHVIKTECNGETNYEKDHLIQISRRRSGSNKKLEFI